MKVFEYQNTPMFLTHQSSQQILIKPEKPILAINNDMTIYTTYSSRYLEHKCHKIHDNFYCDHQNIMSKIEKPDCTLALFQKDKSKIATQCPVTIGIAGEQIIQINMTSFYVFTPKDVELYVTCNDRRAS